LLGVLPSEAIHDAQVDTTTITVRAMSWASELVVLTIEFVASSGLSGEQPEIRVPFHRLGIRLGLRGLPLVWGATGASVALAWWAARWWPGPIAAGILAVSCSVVPILAFILSVACIDGWRHRRSGTKVCGGAGTIAAADAHFR
jgi:hypothetical protein